MIKVPVNIAALLADNLKSRARLGLRAIGRTEQENLRSWLNPAPLALEADEPLDDPAQRELLANMLKVLGLKLEDVAFNGPARLRIHLCGQEPPSDAPPWLWHPARLLERPQLKKQAYSQLKQLRKSLELQRVKA